MRVSCALKSKPGPPPKSQPGTHRTVKTTTTPQMTVVDLAQACSRDVIAASLTSTMTLSSVTDKMKIWYCGSIAHHPLPIDLELRCLYDCCWRSSREVPGLVTLEQLHSCSDVAMALLLDSSCDIHSSAHERYPTLSTSRRSKVDTYSARMIYIQGGLA